MRANHVRKQTMSAIVTNSIIITFKSLTRSNFSPFLFFTYSFPIIKHLRKFTQEPFNKFRLITLSIVNR
ncbi:hypothetical protein QVD17_02791 [Tagetes erecta]|uniref:Uncharacterized protein n=1 Tax=Tagetes erecta TaxID=13708 RepID=A0AAD8LDF1_TARER|nr:hypothetical protein QVD17_02791 [Tagetes erecta]